MINWIVSLALAGVVAVFFLRRMLRNSRIILAQVAAYRRGDYHGQLQIIEGFRVRGSQPRDYLFFRGTACFQLGRLEVAELALRRSLSGEKNRKLRTVARDQLGRILMEQGRWDDAADCFRECIAEDPRRGGSHRALAELLLRHGQQPEAALDAASLAVSSDRAAPASRGGLSKLDHDINLSESLAIYAWALARSGASQSEVDPALNEAFQLCGESTKPTLAELHYFAGYAHANLRNIAESRRHFQRAAKVDPLGNYGRLAESAAGTNTEAPRHGDTQ
jgi:tetratricopeptide (TPR) repeat protein